MDKNFKRALRRHHSYRVKQRYKRRVYWLDESDERMVGIVAKTPRLCSCWMCGNPRKYYNEKTIQERKADEFEKEVALPGQSEKFMKFLSKRSEEDALTSIDELEKKLDL